MPTQTARVPRPHPAAVRLRVALEALAEALTSVDLGALLACETALADALSEVDRSTPDASWERRATARELAVAGATLTRCRRLGSTLLDAVRLTLAAQGRNQGYGRPLAERGTRHSLEVKV
jgi:hypothetical protein